MALKLQAQAARTRLPDVDGLWSQQLPEVRYVLASGYSCFGTGALHRPPGG